MAKKTMPYGAWQSPITAELIVSKAIGLGLMTIDGKTTYWIEGRPAEGGRMVAVERAADGTTRDLNPQPFNVRSRVHEYGGAAYTAGGGQVYFVNFSDQRIYRVSAGDAPAGDAPAAITPEKAWRYADLQIDARRNRLICVREDHSQADREAVNTLAAAPLDGGEQTVLAEGYDFYSTPRISPDGSRLAWLAWNHPNMPWDENTLWTAKFAADGGLSEVKQVAGGKEVAIFQPEWSPDGRLYFISDRSGWWNVYRQTEDGDENVLPMEAEFGMPMWVFGMSSYGFADAETLVCSYVKEGAWRLGMLNTKTLKLEAVEWPYSALGYLRARDGRVVFSAATPKEPMAIVEFDVKKRKFETLRKSSEVQMDEEYISVPREIEFPTKDGRMAFAIYYPPQNKDYNAPEGKKPPLIVSSHGGPTSAAEPGFDLQILYWTSRGFGYLDVNYGGSTGYGRAYRERLAGTWGITDVDDCAYGALYLAEQGEVDGERLIIVGGSAGGYTTLAALTFRNIFKAGASHYGIADLETLATDTHKFESRYLDKLVAPYPAGREVYMERSPIHHVDQLNCPVIFFQGLDDKVVSPDQAERMAEALKKKGLPVAYLAFEGEGHGFRKAENIRRALEAELYFYQRIFGMPITAEAMQIDNLAEPRQNRYTPI